MLTNLLKVRKIVSEGFRWSVFVSQTKFVYLILLAGSSLWGFMIRLSCAKGDIFVLFSSAIFYLFVKNHQNHTPLSNGIYLITERFKTIWASRLKTLRGKKLRDPQIYVTTLLCPQKYVLTLRRQKIYCATSLDQKLEQPQEATRLLLRLFLAEKFLGDSETSCI